MQQATQPQAIDLCGNETVLLVEDDDAARRISQRALQTKGYQVLAAADGEQALAVCDREGDRVNLLLTDLVMPKMGGLALAREFRARFPRVPIIYMSGYTENAIGHQGELDPGAAFLEKPFVPSQLLTSVRVALNGALSGVAAAAS